MNKDRAVFYLRRRLRELEDLTADADPVKQAERRMSYDARIEANRRVQLLGETLKGEMEALHEILALVVEAK